MFGLGLVRFMPRPLRPGFVRSVDWLRATTTRLRLAREGLRNGATPPPADASMVLVGLFSSPTGLGQGARLMLADLRRQGRAVTAVDATAALFLPGGVPTEGVLPVAALRSLPPGPLVLHLNPPLYGMMVLRMPRALRRQSWLIAYWAWELEVVPQHWLADSRVADEFWVPSGFVAEALRRRIGPLARQTVRVVPHAVDAIPFGPRRTPADIDDARARHGLPQDAFIAGYSFAMGSNFTRKNPLAAIAAFRAAFPPEGRPARLLLRWNDSDLWPEGTAALAAAAREDPRIILFDGQARRMPIGDLYRAIDVYLSLHRSEGYGLNLAEAASLGVPVLATGYGMPADILARPEVDTVGWSLVPVRDPQRAYTDPGTQWAEPDLAEAAAKLCALGARRGSG